MSETAADQLRRILALIPRLADGDDHPVDDIAGAVGTSVDTLVADLALLVERYDLPRGFIEGVQIYLDDRSVSVHTQHFLRPMRLTLSELCALELGLALARRERPPDEIGAVDSALARLRSVITQVPNDAALDSGRVAELGGVAAPEHTATFREAIRGRRKAELTYRKGGATEADVRIIRPYALAFANTVWYAIAFCERTGAIRFFRLDRVDAITLLPEKFEVPATFSAQGLVRDGQLFSGESPRTVRIRYSPRIARWVAERAGAELAADGSLELEHPMADVGWAVRHALQYGPEAEVLEPEDVRDEMVRVLDGLAGGE